MGCSPGLALRAEIGRHVHPAERAGKLDVCNHQGDEHQKERSSKIVEAFHAVRRLTTWLRHDAALRRKLQRSTPNRTKEPLGSTIQSFWLC